jgi:hypothetical protein
MIGIVRKIGGIWIITWDAPDTGTTEPILHWEKPLSPEGVDITESSIANGYVFEGREVEFEIINDLGYYIITLDFPHVP